MHDEMCVDCQTSSELIVERVSPFTDLQTSLSQEGSNSLSPSASSLDSYLDEIKATVLFLNDFGDLQWSFSST